MSDKRHALYRFFGEGGTLLYVGITHDPTARWRQHEKTKTWWHDIVGITVEQFPSREAVLEAEQVAIRAEAPRYNIVHNRKPRNVAPSRPAVSAEDMPDQCFDFCDDNVTYFPYKWVRGTGFYRCSYGHEWTCGWGHNESSVDDGWIEFVARNVVYVPHDHGRIRCPYCGRPHTHGDEDGYRVPHCGREFAPIGADADDYYLVAWPGVINSDFRELMKSRAERTLRYYRAHIRAFHSTFERVVRETASSA